MTYETILFDVQDGIARLTLNRPDTYNALNMKMYEELLHALKQCQRDREIRVIVLTGAGKAFSSGADLNELQAKLGTFNIAEMLRQGLNQISLGIRQLEKPVICALNGVAAGAGAGISLACDMRLASDKASYVFAAFVNIGIIPDAGSTYFLPQLVGTARAFEIAMFADGQNRMTASAAESYGIVNRVVAHERLEDEVTTVAQKMAGMATKAIGLTKRAIYKNAERSLAQALDYEAQLQAVAFGTHDFQEGLSAFNQKRQPQFKGE